MTDKQEEELKRIPPLRNQTHSPGVSRSTAMDEIDLLQVDRNGRLYWDGKPVEVSCSAHLLANRWRVYRR